jgi:hypothetical protein
MVPFAEGPVVNRLFSPGVHEVRLLTDDGNSTGLGSVLFEVITAGQAVEELILAVHEANLPSYNKRPLLASLKAAVASFDRGN